MSEALQTVVLVDPWSGGHHTSSMCNFAQAVLTLGFRVLVLCPEPANVRDRVRELAPSLVDNLVAEVFEWESYASPFWRIRDTYIALKRFSHVAHAIREARRQHPDLRRPRAVVFCWFDDYLMQASPLIRFLLPVIFPYRMTGMFFHPRFLRIRNGDYQGMRRSALRVLRSPNVCSVAVLDDALATELQGLCGKPVFAFPEYMDTNLPAQPGLVVGRMLEKANGRPIVAIVGGLERRKGVLTLLDVAKTMDPSDALFALIGSLGAERMATYSPEERDRLSTLLGDPPDNVFVLTERMVREVDFNDVIAHLDLLYAAYEGFPHSSGLLTKAAAYGKPVIVDGSYCMGERVAHFGLGETITAGNREEAQRAILRVVRASAGCSGKERSRHEAYLRAHSWAAILQAFRRMLGSCGVKLYAEGVPE